ncbi:MAG: holo-ACP synthase [bacterium]
MSKPNLNRNWGIGTDIERIDRFRNQHRIDSKSFLNKIFTPGELDYCFSRESAAPHLAARFSGKEAVIKAITSLKSLKVFYTDIEISNNELGVPIVKLKSDKVSNLAVKLSLSHSEDTVVAFAIVMEV